MSSCYGNIFKINIFGQSHSESIGVDIDGLPVGSCIDTDELQKFLDRRAPGKSEFATKRKEKDKVHFLSGVSENDENKLVTNGETIKAVIYNTDTRSKDYSELNDVPRPSHADYVARVKYGEKYDVAGGGAFSGRMTAPMCIAGGICKQILQEQGIDIEARIYSIAGISNLEKFSNNKKTNDPVSDITSEPNTMDYGMTEEMQQKIREAAIDLDSVGGIVECRITGVKVGVGGPMFDGLESKIASAIFGIPAVKGIEFGNGFEAAELRGSQNNDAFRVKDGEIYTETNNHGGILGGITSGMPIIFRVAFKPTPSIAKEQKSISLSRMENTTLQIKGRHDPCIVPRAVPVVEAVAAIAIYDALLG